MNADAVAVEVVIHRDGVKTGTSMKVIMMILMKMMSNQEIAT